jgi:hypothetical protein
MKNGIVWFDFIEALNRRFKVDDFARYTIDEICGNKKCFIQNFRGMEASSKRERPTSTLCVGVFSQQNHFIDRHGAGDLMHNSNVGKKKSLSSHTLLPCHSTQ